MVFDKKARKEEVLVPIPDHPLTRQVLRSSLRDQKWLHGEVLDAYMALLQKRADNAGKKHKFLPTHFYQLISAPNYHVGAGLAYVKEQDLFEWDYLYVPMNVNENHWVMVLVNFKKRTLWALDSLPPLGQAGYGMEKQLYCVARFLHDLAKLRSLPIEVLKWHRKDMRDIPTQTDDHNCGVYVLTFAEMISRGCKEIVIDRSLLPQMRNRITLELVLGSINRKVIE